MMRIRYKPITIRIPDLCNSLPRIFLLEIFTVNYWGSDSVYTIIPDFHNILWRIAVTSACGNVGTFCTIFQYTSTIGSNSQILVSIHAARLRPHISTTHNYSQRRYYKVVGVHTCAYERSSSVSRAHPACTIYKPNIRKTLLSKV